MIDSLPADRHLPEAFAAVAAAFFKSTKLHPYHLKLKNQLEARVSSA